MIDGVFVCAPQILLLVLYLVMYCFYLHITLVDASFKRARAIKSDTHEIFLPSYLSPRLQVLHPLAIDVKVKVQISEPHLTTARVSKACVELDFC